METLGKGKEPLRKKLSSNKLPALSFDKSQRHLFQYIYFMFTIFEEIISNYMYLDEGLIP